LLRVGAASYKPSPEIAKFDINYQLRVNANKELVKKLKFQVKDIEKSLNEIYSCE
jgi:hypothetical protein